ncbi:hypothetical protein Leryth_014154 [Lithospermum erythrorhizon]|nr:hypothetical protein Leryth_014154 [Lithospermum erythrorhizon]
MVKMEDIQDKLLECGMETLINDSSTVLHGKHKIFMDGDWVGMCEDSASFVSELRQRRHRREVHQQVEVKRDEHQEVRIYTDAGRILRPLLVVENLQKVKAFKGGSYSFESLLDRGVIELIGPEEEEDIKAAWGVKYLLGASEEDPPARYTHVELDMSFLLGLSCGLIPFANHDHAKRVLYQSEKHSQQAMGFGTTNPEIRVDTNTHQLFYPQRPLFRTMLSDCLGKSRAGVLPRPEYYNGQCAIVAVNVHLGYNQEDSIVMNRASLERGMFRTEHIRSYKSEIENNEGAGKKLKPEDIVNFGKTQSKIGRVDSLDDDGFPFIGANLQSGDIVIGKYSESGIRSPCLGDKFSSMHGQKGVLGFLESQENFPFTKQGVVPDIVINPHAFPSRQTSGQLLEAALGKGIALGGGLKYATPFSTLTVEAITAQLHRLGFTRWGNERVYSGRTGEMVESLVFMGPTFYQRLTHMSEDKVKFRNTGPVHPFTRQPVADRKRFGGIKFGEMERDCLIAHVIPHRCTFVGNARLWPAFGKHGGHKVRGPYCKFCESTEDIVLANVPYGAKLLGQELFSMGITLKFDAEVC